jgi:iron complex transport system substrate-binding protein
MRGYWLILVWMLAIAGCDTGHSDRGGQQKILSLSPGLTEVLYALDLGDRLVGRSDYCDWPTEAVNLPTAGTSLAPNFEAVAALAPGAILIEANQTSHRAELSRLTEVVELPWLTLDDVVTGIQQLGDRFGKPQRGRELAGQFSRQLGVAPPANAPGVLLTLGANVDGSPLWYIRRNSLHGAALNAAGGRNAVDRDVSGNVSLSVEGLLALDPEVIIALLPDSGDEAELRAQVLAAFGRLKTLRAVRNGRVGVVIGAGYLRTGPRVLDLVGQIRDELQRLEAAVGS